MNFRFELLKIVMTHVFSLQKCLNEYETITWFPVRKPGMAFKMLIPVSEVLEFTAAYILHSVCVVSEIVLFSLKHRIKDCIVHQKKGFVQCFHLVL